MTWRNRSACLGKNPDLFFPDGRSNAARLQIEEARAVCRGCDVVKACLKRAMESDQDTGVWGGLSEDERQVLETRNARTRRAGRVSPSPRGGPGGGRV